MKHILILGKTHGKFNETNQNAWNCGDQREWTISLSFSARGKPVRERAPFCQFPDDDLHELLQLPIKVWHHIIIHTIVAESPLVAHHQGMRTLVFCKCYHFFHLWNYQREIIKPKNWHDKSRSAIIQKPHVFNYLVMLLLLPKSHTVYCVMIWTLGVMTKSISK